MSCRPNLTNQNIHVLDCSAVENTVKIRWIGPSGAFITEDRSQRVHAESSGPHGHRLVVMNATAGQDDGQYKCTIGSTDDKLPRESIELTLKIYQSASFKDTAQHLALPTGQSGTLNCRIEFDSNVLSPSVTWMRNSIPIDMLNDSSLQAIEYDPSRQLSQLQISNVAREHEGSYTCRALAVTPQLSKISEHQIQLDTQYPPQFDSNQQVVWVESSQSLASRSAVAAGASPMHSNQYDGQHNSAAQQNSLINNRNLFGPGAARNRYKERHFATAAQTNNSSASTEKIVRVELRCTCEANPPASILWTSSNPQMYVLSKGAPLHILEEPTVEVNGQNSTSTLIIGYNLDSNWQHRRDSYICSASNKQGQAQKRFTIEQGDPPPAFNVGPNKRYDPKTSLFEFTLLGPNLDPQAAATQNNRQSQQHTASQTAPVEIVPPVDAFRIRAEAQGSAELRTGHLRRHFDASVQWNVANLSAQSTQVSRYGQTEQQQAAKNLTVSLNKLPTGNLRLFLEAHNAVGWSPNATYLGDFDIVSGVAKLSATSLYLQLAISFAVAFLLIVQQSQQVQRETL